MLLFQVEVYIHVCLHKDELLNFFKLLFQKTNLLWCDNIYINIRILYTMYLVHVKILNLPDYSND